MAHDSSPDEIDIVSVWGGLRSNLPRLLGCTLAAGMLAAGTLSIMAPRYEAKTELAIIAKSTNPFPEAEKRVSSDVTLTRRLDREAINTHVRALMAPELLLRVGRKLKLETRPEFNSAAGSIDQFDATMRLLGIGGPADGESNDDRVLAAMKRSVEVAAARESRYIEIRATSTDKQVAADIANTLADTYRQKLVEVPVKETNQVVEALRPKIEQLGREVLEAEAAAERFRGQTDQFRGGPQAASVTTQRMSSLNEELARAEAARTEAEAKWQTARDLSQSGAADTLPEVQSSRVIQDLIAQRVRVERQVNEARAVLLPAHPRMRPLNEKLAGIRQAIRAEVSRVVSGLERSFRATQLRALDVKRQLDDLKARVVSTSGNEARLKSLENVAKAKRAELERLQKQLEDNRTLAATRTVPVEAQIESTARASGIPVFPLTGKYTLLVMAATLMLGFLVITSRQLMLAGQAGGLVPHNRRETDRAASGGIAGARASDDFTAQHDGAEHDIRSASALDADEEHLRQFDPAEADASYELEEQDFEDDDDIPPTTIAGLARHISENVPEDGGYRTMVVGESDKIDPIDEAMDLVVELSETGAGVVIVDWSLDGDGLLEDDEENDAPGLADLLAGRATFEEIIVPLTGTRVHYMAPGRVRMESEDLLDADGLNLVLDALDEAYDHIVIVGRFRAAQALFETIQGRVDAGVVIADANRNRAIASDPEGAFLGFEVTDIDIVRYERSNDQAIAVRRSEIQGVPATV